MFLLTLLPLNHILSISNLTSVKANELKNIWKWPGDFLTYLGIRGGFRKFCHRCYNFVNRHNRLLYYTLIERATFLLYNDAKTMQEKK